MEGDVWDVPAVNGCNAKGSKDERSGLDIIVAIRVLCFSLRETETLCTNSRPYSCAEHSKA